MKKAQVWDPYADFQKTVLPNGLTIYSAYWERSWMQVRFCVHTGAAYDPVGKSGLAHFVEHMLAPNLENNFKVIKNIGGRATFGNTSLYFTEFHFDIPLKVSAIEKVFSMFGKILSNVPNDTFLEKERLIILQEFYRKYPCKNNYMINHMQFQNNFQSTPLENFLGVLGTPETINLISIDDIKDFFKAHYDFSNMNIVVVGGITHADVVKYIENSIFSTGEVGKLCNIPKCISNIPLPKNNETILQLSEFFPGYVSDVSSFCSWTIIPGHFSKKLIEMYVAITRNVLTHEIRWKSGGTYNVNVEYEFIGGCYQLSIGTMFDPSNLDFVREAFFVKFLGVPKSEKVFNAMKHEILMSYHIPDLTVNDFCENARSDLVRHGRIITTKEEIANLRSVSFDDYNALSCYLSNPKRWWSLIEVP